MPKPAYPKPPSLTGAGPAAAAPAGGGGSAVPPAPRARRRALATVLLVAGVAGVAVSLAPWSLSAVASVCPYVAARTGGAALWARVLPPSWAAALGVSPAAAAAALGASPSGGFATAGGLDAATGLPVFSAAELARYDGAAPGSRILLAFNGVVYDVTDKGAVFYGPGAGYSLFAARDSTRALALGSLDEGDVRRGGDVSDFPASETYMNLLREQEAFYSGKYPAVGVIRGHRVETGARAAARAPSESEIAAEATAEAPTAGAAGEEAPPTAP